MRAACRPLESRVWTHEGRGAGQAWGRRDLEQKLLPLALLALPDGHVRLRPGSARRSREQRRAVAVQTGLVRGVNPVPGRRGARVRSRRGVLLLLAVTPDMGSESLVNF